MNALTPIDAVNACPAILDRVTSILASARNAAEVIEAKELAGAAFDQARRAARLAKAKGAHDDLISTAYRMQADALELEARAKRRLADEYDAAQERGEVGREGRPKTVPDGNGIAPVAAADLGLTRKDIHEARQVRDAEVADPGVVRRALNDKLAKGEEPTKTALRQEVLAAAQRGLSGAGRAAGSSNRNPHYSGPDPQWDAMLAVSDGCRTIMAKAGALSPQYLLGGFRVEGQRARNLAVITECRDFLTTILEHADAQ